MVDFDESRNDLRIREIAIAAFHFGNEGSPSEAAPASGEEMRPGHAMSVLMAAANGIGAPLREEEIRALPWLMIESCASEALSTIARTGRFGAVPAAEMLRFVERKATWISANARRLLPP